METPNSPMWDMIKILIVAIMTKRDAAATEHTESPELYPDGLIIECEGYRVSLPPDHRFYYRTGERSIIVVKDWQDLSVLAGAKIRTNAEVLKLIEPVDPENIQPIGPNIWAAKWCPPVPMMDLEILGVTPGVMVLGEPYEPANLKGWLAVRFTLTE